MSDIVQIVEDEHGQFYLKTVSRQTKIKEKHAILVQDVIRCEKYQRVFTTSKLPEGVCFETSVNGYNMFKVASNQTLEPFKIIFIKSDGHGKAVLDT
jgi:hypothetical protein